ncbi:hypothetical protein [Novosphingobium sp. AAP1]|uniref:hypothetical protein n=1 Tax=Novosphingobium sp. AAP1 TaxID=1523413 RepID=UPI000A5FAEA6|nr:hypothetical protein [Novosphingobium sp. AAP1]
MDLPIPALQDVVRLTGHDLDSTAINLRRYYRSTGSVWGYDPCKKLAPAVFSLQMSRQAAVNACGQKGHPLGRPHNREVGGLIWDAAAGRGTFMCHPLKPRKLALRRDFSVTVDPLFSFRENGRHVIVYLQPRRTHVPGAHGLRLIASAISSLFAVDELEGADVLLLDASMPEGAESRQINCYNLEDLPLLEPAQMEAQFQRFVDAYDRLTAEGVKRKERRPKPPRDLGEDLFGSPQPA